MTAESVRRMARLRAIHVKVLGDRPEALCEPLRPTNQ
jgi:hypothetical protein